MERAAREMKNLADFLSSSRNKEKVREVQVVQEKEKVQVLQEEVVIAASFSRVSVHPPSHCVEEA